MLQSFVDVQRNDRDNQDQDIAIELFDDVEDDMGDDEDHDQDQDNEEGEELWSDFGKPITSPAFERNRRF